MKSQIYFILILAVGLAISPTASALDDAGISKALAGATALELPAKCGSLVAKAATADKEKVASVVVKTAVALNPASTVLIVSAVIREDLAVAPLVAVTAANLQHQQIDRITKAATAAAPSEAVDIVAALIKSFPQDYGVIAKSAADAVPSAAREILAVVADCHPALKPFIRAVSAKSNTKEGNLSIETILTQSYNQAIAAGSVASNQIQSSYFAQAQNSGNALSFTPQTTLNYDTGLSGVAAPRVVGTTRISPPIFGPPFTPLPPTVLDYNNNYITPELPGGRNYASP